MSGRTKLIVKQRVLLLFFIFTLLIFLLVLRLVWIQIFQTDHLRKMAVEQRLRLLQVEPKRGLIYDRNGKELAVSASAETVVALPTEIEDPEEVAKLLAPILNLSYDEILSRITQPRAAIYLERKIDDIRVQKIKDLKISGITFLEESKRYYPNQDLACHVLGFAGIDSQGLEGLEVALDKYLRGTPGRIASEKDASGRELPQGVQRYIPPQDGLDIYLTIDQVIQYIAERELEIAMSNLEAEGGSIIVIEPHLGEILAMANWPTYNPNNFAAYSPSLWRNAAISDSYEPGSTFKIVTMSTALDEGVVSIEDRFYCPGYIRVGGEIINCWKAGGHGSISFQKVVEHSCNPGFVQVGMRLGKENFYKYIKAFEFGNKIGIELPGEAKGMVYSLDNIGPVELATMTFGHGIAVTPLQMAMSMATIANDGLLLQPRLVKEIRNKDGELIEAYGPTVIRQVLSRDTARIGLSLLAAAVEAGTGGNAEIEGYRVGGKTGTAKRYGGEIYDSSFVGVLPASDPQIVILVVFYGITSDAYYGGEVAAPVFKEIAYDIIRYMNIKPIDPHEIHEFTEERESVYVPNVINKSTVEAMETLRLLGLNVRLEGTGALIADQIPKSGASVHRGTTVILFYENSLDEKVRYCMTVPDVTGMSLHQSAELLADLGFTIKFDGSGFVVEQFPVGGEQAPVGSTIQIKLR